MFRVSATTLASVVFLMLPGCAAETGGQGDGIPKDEAPEKFADLICEAYYSCDCNDFIDPPAFTSEENCAAEIEAEALSDIDTADDAGLTYDEACAKKYFDFYNGLDCASLNELDLSQLDTAFQGLDCKIFHGDDEPGDSCDYLDVGRDSCVEGANCNNGTCEATNKRDPGDACDQGDACTGGSICTDVEGGNDNQCVLLPDAGGTCLGALDLCNIGLACNQTEKKCETAPDAGDACAPSGISRCSEGNYCDMDECAELPGGGEGCAPGNQCAPGFSCMGGTCETDAPLICTYALVGAN